MTARSPRPGALVTAAPTTHSVRRLAGADVAEAVRWLTEAASPLVPAAGWVANQSLLDALDNGDHHRMVVWPPAFANYPIGLVYTNASGTVVPAGHPDAAEALAGLLEQVPWRVLIGDRGIGEAVVRASGRRLFRRQPRHREQVFMVARQATRLRTPPGFRAAETTDIDALTDFACALHIEDRMGPPVSRSGRQSVRDRVQDSILAGSTWVVEREGAPVAKADLSLRSSVRGAQVAGVYVDRRWRGMGIGGALVATVTRLLLAHGAPAVSLHLRADNPAAQAAYKRAGFTEQGSWVLALR